jgi:hypothetical protein
MKKRVQISVVGRMIVTEYICYSSGSECGTTTENNLMCDEPHIIVAGKGLK